MRFKAVYRTLMHLMLAFALIQQVDAALDYKAISTPIRNVVCGIYYVLYWIAGAVAALVFIAAIVQYIYARDNPGGRKQAMDIMIHAVLGLILVGITSSVIDSLGYVKACFST